MATIRDIFAERKLRYTPQRELIYEALRTSCSHPTADELHRLVSSDADRVSQATVYNTLAALQAAGLACCVISLGGVARWDGNCDTHTHVHVRGDERVLDLPHELDAALQAAVPKALLGQIESALGVSIESIHLVAQTKQVDGHGVEITA
jgi:Fe2+ or Zn2+ uptake regulation protein